MKKSFLRLYDKLVIALLMGTMGLVGCGVKKNTKNNPSDGKDTTVIHRRPGQIIAMYGVREPR